MCHRHPCLCASDQSKGIVGLPNSAQASNQQLQIELKERQQSETRFRTLVEQSPISIQIFTPDGNRQEANRAWEQMWGSSEADFQNYNVFKNRAHTTKTQKILSIPSIWLESKKIESVWKLETRRKLSSSSADNQSGNIWSVNSFISQF